MSLKNCIYEHRQEDSSIWSMGCSLLTPDIKYDFYFLKKNQLPALEIHLSPNSFA